jgi:RNA polymerase sigma factor (TIGR02999 family)
MTQMLGVVEQGEPRAGEVLLPLVYEQLRRLAAHRMAQERPGQTLQATAFVHEAYLRLNGSGNHQWNGRSQFFAAAADAMRRILVDNARRKQSLKRGGNNHRTELDDLPIAAPTPSEELLAVHEVLDRLSEEHPLSATGALLFGCP